MTTSPLPVFSPDNDQIFSLLPWLQDTEMMSEAQYSEWGHVVYHSCLNAAHRRLAVGVPFPELEADLQRFGAHRQVEVEEALAKLQRRAERMGLPLPTMEYVREEQLPVVARFFDSSRSPSQWWWSKTGAVERFFIVRPQVSPVRLDGWTFAAKIECVEGENLISSSPSFTGQIPLEYRHGKQACDHCGVRRARTATFVLAHEDGHFARVGRNCLADFLGDRSAASVVASASIESELGALFGEGGGMGERAASPETYLSIVALVIENSGWLSRKVAMDTGRESTSGAAWDILFPTRPRKDGLTRSDVTDAHRADAVAALAWAKALPETDSDYLHNLRVISGLGAWEFSRCGLGAAVMMSYQREQERLKRMEFERKLPSLPLGQAGEKFGCGKGKKAIPPRRARVLGVYEHNGDYGLTTIVRLQFPGSDAHVCDAVWFASGRAMVVVDPAAVQAQADTQAAVYRANTEYDRVQNELHTGWHAFCEANPDSPITWSEYHDARVEEHKLRVKAAADASRAAYDAQRDAAELVGTRAVEVGDLVDVGGTIKKVEVSSRTKRTETHLTRCSLALVVAPSDV